MNFEVIKEFLEAIGGGYTEVEGEIHLEPKVFYEVWKYVGQPEIKTYILEDEIVEPGSYDPPQMKYTDARLIKIKKAYFETLEGVKIVTDYVGFQKILKEKN